MEGMSDINLGGIITVLRTVDPTLVLRAGFRGAFSYRGYYQDLAFLYGANVTVAESLACAQAAVHAVYTGYKGGSYLMGVKTTCWLVDDKSQTVDEPITKAWLTEQIALATEDAKARATSETPTSGVKGAQLLLDLAPAPPVNTPPATQAQIENPIAGASVEVRIADALERIAVALESIDACFKRNE